MIVKYSILGIVLCFCLALAFATPAFATVIDVNYYWYSTGGTKATGDENWISGDISGAQLFKVEELWTSGDVRINESLYPGIGEFKYDIHRMGGYSGYIYDWKVYNPAHVTAVATGSPTVNGVTWSEAHTADYWYWYTTDPNGKMNGQTGYFRIYTDAPRGIVTGDVSDYVGNEHTTFANGRVSGPAPEPASMALLGLGLIGFAGKVARRKFMA